MSDFEKAEAALDVQRTMLKACHDLRDSDGIMRHAYCVQVLESILRPLPAQPLGESREARMERENARLRQEVTQFYPLALAATAWVASHRTDPHDTTQRVARASMALFDAARSYVDGGTTAPDARPSPSSEKQRGDKT